jgi:predicted transcriptional regulator
MPTARTRKSRVFTISFPDALARQVEETAREESRNISELFREAWRAYKFQQYEQQLIALRPPVDPTEKVVTQDQIEAWVDEIRSENFKRKQSPK